MKKVIFAAAALLLGLALNGFAQEATAVDTQKQEIKTIFSYKTELGLTDKQQDSIRKLLLDLQNIFVEKAKEINTLRQDLSRMIKDKKDMRTIRRKIEDIAKIQVDNTCRDIETSRKIEGTLNPEQLKKWHDIQKQVREKTQAQAAESKAKKESTAKPKK
ncbi:MAG: hypothetical protein WC723_02930 [Candidatus Omnitrophota bacterium]